MQLGMIGLGRMGANMSRRLTAAGHEVVGYDIDAGVVSDLVDEGVVTAAPDLKKLVGLLDAPRHVWMMLPAAFVDGTLDGLLPLLSKDDAVVDGGNSFYRDDVDRFARISPTGVHYLDAGVSGGVWGLERGYCLMVGGEAEAVERLRPVFEALVPGVDAAARTPGRTGDPAPEEQGWLHCGPAGAGHFVKMVHNGIEYGLMAAFAEGFAILERADVGARDRALDAETAPLRQPEYYQFDLPLDRVAEVWRRGSVVGSWLLDLTAAALCVDNDLAAYSGHVSDSGEGRWTMQAAIDEGVPANVIASALHQRFSSRDLGDYGDKLLSAMRQQFGGHAERPAK
ncbi:MAG TPA: decarboxylating 6-phosphogluconate dehydrogenase [Acidimicrobiia bacterium]|nr:decarboxylating 6-phosphogluconate dehydrogenase [Acidimicrobiia bacterium]